MGVGIINFYENKINNAVIGEFGHTTVKKDGPLCFCGNHGCLEMMCSVDAVLHNCDELLKAGKCEILKTLMEESDEALSYRLVLEAFRNGDNDVKGVLEECGKYLGIGLANIINIFNPQRIIINGHILLSCNFIYETAVEEAKQRAHEQFIRDMKFETVGIGVEEAVKGVSLFVTDRIFELSGPDFCGFAF